MGYLLHILVALGATALYEIGLTSGVSAPWLVLMLCGLPHAVAVLARHTYMRGRFRLAGVEGFFVHHGAPLLHVLATCLFGWPETAAKWTGTQLSLVDWPRPSLLLVLLPYIVYELLSIDAKARLGAPHDTIRRSLRGFHLRMFLSSMLPVVLYILLASVVGANEVLRIQVEQVALWNAAFGGILLAIFVVFLPILLRNTWETVPLGPGVERSVLEDVAERASFRCRELLVWRTGNLMANAAIIGVGPRSRVVLFSDSLLAQLSPRELAAVFGHEIGHAFHRHVLIFVAWALAFFMGVDLAVTWLDPQSEWVLGLVAIAGLGTWYYGFGWLSRRFELQADLHSIRLTGDPEALISALEQVGGNLRDVAGWRHFSITDRVRFLRRAMVDYRVARGLARRLAIWAWAGGLAFLLLAALEVHALVGTLEVDRIHADLRLGRYAQAAERAEAEDVDEELIELVRFAAATYPDETEGARPGAVEFERAALAALAKGDRDSALAHLQLGSLRGFDALVPPAVVLELAGSEQPEEALEALADVTPEWRAILEPLVRNRE